MKKIFCVSFVVLLALATQIACTSKETSTKAPAATGSSATPSADARPAPNPLKNAYFGDFHLHTSYSMDAFAFGTRTTPEDSFKFAMGEPVEYFGKQWKRSAPLDFLAVTDHAEYLGTVRESINPERTLRQDASGTRS